MTGILNIFLANVGTRTIQLGLAASNLDEFFFNSASRDGSTGSHRGISMGPDGDFWTLNFNNTGTVNDYTQNNVPNRIVPLAGQALGSPNTAVLRPYEVMDLNINAFTQSVALQQLAEGSDWSLDGTKMFVANITTGNLEEYGVSVPWDVTTLAGTPDETYATGYATLSGIYVSIEGSYIYFTGEDRTCSRVLLNTPWDLTTATDQVTTGNLESYGSPLGHTYSDVLVSHDGIKLLLLDTANENILQFDMTTAHNLPDLTAGTEADFTLGLTQRNNELVFYTAMCKSHDQTKIFVGANGNSSVDRYDWDIVSPLENWNREHWNGVQVDNVSNVHSMQFYNNGSNVMWCLQSGKIYQDSCAEPYKLDNPPNGTLEATLLFANCRGAWFDDTGDTLFLLEFNNSELRTRNITNGNYDFSGGVTNGATVVLSPPFNDLLSGAMALDGTYFMGFDNAAKNLHMYEMTTPFDITTLVSRQIRYPARGANWDIYDMRFNHDGTGAVILYIGIGGDINGERALDIWSFSTPYDLNTISVVSTRNINDDIPTGSPPGWNGGPQCVAWDEVGQQQITVQESDSDTADNTSVYYSSLI